LNVEESAGFRDGQAERLFAEDVLARFGCLDGPGYVKVVGKRVVDYVNLRVGEKLFIRAVDLFDSEVAGWLFSLGAIARGDGGDVGQLALLHCGNDFLDADCGGAQHTPADFG
jgi:hypothetical protein